MTSSGDCGGHQERGAEGFRHAFRERAIPLRTMPRPLRLISGLAVAQMLAAALLLVLRDHGPPAVDMAFAGPCDVTGTTRDGHEVEVSRLNAVILLVAARLRQDPLLGSVANMEAAALCSDPRFSATCD